MPSSYSFTYRRLTGGKVVNRGKDLPGGSVDLIVTAMEDQVDFQAKSCRRKKINFLLRKCGVRSAVSLGTETRSHGLR